MNQVNVIFIKFDVVSNSMEKEEDWNLIFTIGIGYIIKCTILILKRVKAPVMAYYWTDFIA